MGKLIYQKDGKKCYLNYEHDESTTKATCNIASSSSVFDDKEFEFTSEQLARMDEIENAVFNLIKVLLRDYDMEWNMELIGPVSDVVCDTLTNMGKTVYYPSATTDENNRITILDNWPSSIDQNVES